VSEGGGEGAVVSQRATKKNMAWMCRRARSILPAVLLPRSNDRVTIQLGLPLIFLQLRCMGGKAKAAPLLSPRAERRKAKRDADNGNLPLLSQTLKKLYIKVPFVMNCLFLFFSVFFI
jgi:hypothetical protein